MEQFISQRLLLQRILKRDFEDYISDIIPTNDAKTLSLQIVEKNNLMGKLKKKLWGEETKIPYVLKNFSYGQYF